MTVGLKPSRPDEWKKTCPFKGEGEEDDEGLLFIGDGGKRSFAGSMAAAWYFSLLSGTELRAGAIEPARICRHPR